MFSRHQCIEQPARKIAEEMIEHCAARVWDKDTKLRMAGDTTHFGQAVPALVEEVRDVLQELLDDLGTGAVQDYVKARGVAGDAILAEEIGPLLAPGHLKVIQAMHDS